MHDCIGNDMHVTKNIYISHKTINENRQMIKDGVGLTKPTRFGKSFVKV